MTDATGFPDELLPGDDEPAFIGEPCAGCGDDVAPVGSAPDQYGRVLHDHRDYNRIDNFGLEGGNWHLECALEASPVFERAGTERFCPNCWAYSAWRLVDADDETRRCCIGCGRFHKGNETKAEREGLVDDGGER